MSDSSNTIQVIIELLQKGDFTGAAAEIEKVKTAAGESAGNYTKMGEASAAAAAQDVEATDKITLSKRELSESMRELQSQFPLLGELARAAYNPMVLSIFTIIGAFEIWKSRVDAMANALGAVQIPDFNDQVEQIYNSAAAWNAQALAITAANEAFNSTKEISDRATAAITAQTDAIKKNLDAKKQLAEAKINLQLAEGQITPEEAAAKKSQIEQGYTAQTAQAEIDARNADLASKQHSIGQFQAEATRLKKQADDTAKAAGLPTNPNDDAAVQKAQQDQIDARQKSIDESRAHLDLFRQAGDPDASLLDREIAQGKLLGIYGASIATPGGEAAAQKAEQDNIVTQEQSQRALEQQQAAQKEAAKKRDDLLSRSTTAAGQAATAQDEYGYQSDPNQPGSLAWQNAQDKKNAATQNQTTGIQTDADAVNEFQRDARIIGRFDSSQHPSPEQASQAEIAANDMNEMLKRLKPVLEHIANYGPIVAELSRVTSRLEAQMGQNGSVN